MKSDKNRILFLIKSEMTKYLMNKIQYADNYEKIKAKQIQVRPCVAV